MEWFIAVGAIVLVAVVLVGLFLGPSHGHVRRPTRHPQPSVERPAAPDDAPPSPPVPTDPPAYRLPPPRPRRHVPRRSGRHPGGRRS